MAFEYPSTITARKKKEKKAKSKAKKNIETKSGDMVQPDPDIHAKDYDDGINKGESRAMKEVIQEAGIKMPKFTKGGGMSSGQAKIAAKAPPPNKLDEKDFAVLRQEKAKGRGMGLQDEKLNPGKIYKAKRGSGLDLPVISSVKPTVNKSKRAQNLSEMKIQFNKQKSRMGKNPNTKKFSSMAEMRAAKGFKPGESASEFNKRRMKLAGVAKAASATRVGKIALGVGAAGVGAAQYLKSKMNKKKDVKKKMGGGMMKKYSKGMSYKDMAPYGGKYAKIKKNMRDEASKNVKRLTTQSSAYDPETRYVVAEQRKGNARRRQTTKTTDQVYLKGVANKMKEDMGSNTRTSILTPSQARERRIIRPKKRRTSSFNMGGMMMQRPMGYKHGTSVTAKCKLGRNKPTKIT